MELLIVQTDSENITENNYTIDNSNVLGKIEVSMSDLETAVREMKSNKSPAYNRLTTYTIKAAEPNVTQWLY
jgi:hypothetical protein